MTADQPSPRLMRIDDVAAYLGCSVSTVRRLKREGIIPRPLRTTRLYDRDAIDRALDHEAGLQSDSHTDEQEVWEGNDDEYR